MKSRKNVPIWQKRKCCFAKTMHQFTHTLSRWPQSISSNRLLAHPIRQIQLPRIVFSSKAQKNGSTFKDFLKMKRYQPPAKYKAEWRFHRRRIGSREGFLGFNRYAQTRPRRVLYNVFQSFCHFTSSPKKKKKTMKKWSLQLLAILRSSTALITNKVSKLLNIARESVSS